MNVFSGLIGIFRQQGLAITLRENRPLRGFLFSAR